jgi:hypothetical protein
LQAVSSATDAKRTTARTFRYIIVVLSLLSLNYY